MIPGGGKFKDELIGSVKANHRLALELAIAKRSDIHTKTAKLRKKVQPKKPWLKKVLKLTVVAKKWLL